MKIGKRNTSKTRMIKLIALLIFFSTGFLITKCQSNEAPYINSIIINADNEQLDFIMTSWLDSFVKHQSQGKDMNQADQLAISDVNKMISNTAK